MSAGGSKRAIVAALVANFGIALAKFVAFAFTRSSAMLAEAVHSVADTGNQVLLLVGGRKALKEPDAEHPFGFGRERFFWAFVVSIILFSVGGLFAVYEGIEKVLHPEPISSPGWAIGTLLVAMCLEANSLRTAVKECRPLKGSASWIAFIRRSKNPELPVVLLEDIGAMLGLIIAFTAIGLDVLTHNAVWDGVGSLLIGILLGVIAVVLSVEMKSLLIGEAADPREEARITAAILSAPPVRELIFLRTQHFGPEQLLVTAKVVFDPILTVPELAAAIDDVEGRLRSAVPAAHFVFIEPDIRRMKSSPESL